MMSVIILPEIANNCAVYGEIIEINADDDKIIHTGNWIYGITIRSLPHSKYIKIPSNNITPALGLHDDNNFVVSNLKYYTNALICLMVVVKTNPEENIVIISPSKEHKLLHPFIHWILKLKSKPLVYCFLSDHKCQDSYIRSNKFLQTVSMKIVEKVEDIRDDVLARTSNIGVPCVIILPPDEIKYSVSQISIQRACLSLLGIAGKLIWMEKIEQIDPCECKCAFSKNLVIAFYNSDVIWKTGSHHKICQYAIKESVNYLTDAKKKN